MRRKSGLFGLISRIYDELDEGKRFSYLIAGVILFGLLGAIFSLFLAGVFCILPFEASFIKMFVTMFMWFGGIGPAIAIVLFATHGNDPFEHSAIVIYYLSVFVTNKLNGSYPWVFFTILIISTIYGMILDSRSKKNDEERELNFLRYENKILKERLEEYEENKHRCMDGKTE